MQQRLVNNGIALETTFHNKLSPDFSLDELVKSETALRYSKPNLPTEEHYQNLRFLCIWLQALRDELGQAVRITSGYRSLWLNKKIGGSKTSAHPNGLAADYHVTGMDNFTLVNRIRRAVKLGNLPPYDQLILEMYDPGTQGMYSWIHTGVARERPRIQNLTAYKTRVLPVGFKRTRYLVGHIYNVPEFLQNRKAA